MTRPFRLAAALALAGAALPLSARADAIAWSVAIGDPGVRVVAAAPLPPPHHRPLVLAVAEPPFAPLVRRIVVPVAPLAPVVRPVVVPVVRPGVVVRYRFPR